LKEAVLRTFANSLLSLLLVATFLWGGCVSCEQYFMFPGKQLHACCNKSGQCERPGKTPAKPEKQDCNRLPFARSGSAHQLHPPAIAPVAIADVVLPLDTPMVLRVSALEKLLEPSPPDLQALNATFLI
jgi:hypothetical protein